MELRPFGATGRDVPVIGQGTWNLPLCGAARDEAIAALRAGVSLGMVHIDTAEMYGDGAVEEFVGEAIAGLPRESLFVVSKVLPSNASFEGTIRACERSLRRMKLSYLDGYLLHWRDGEPLGETMRALETLVRDGKTRSLGVSNFEVDDLREAQSALEREPIACNQVLYHLGERSVEEHELPYCREHDIALVAYTPFGRDAWRRQPAAVEIQRIARSRGISEHAVILAFLTRDPLAFAIPKASSGAHVAENAQAGELRLAPDEIAAIDRAFPARRRRGGLPTL